MNFLSPVVKKSWVVLQGRVQEIGILTFLRMFDQYPETKEAFAAFRHSNAEELKSNAVFHNHASRVIRVIEKVRQLSPSNFYDHSHEGLLRFCASPIDFRRRVFRAKLFIGDLRFANLLMEIVPLWFSQVIERLEEPAKCRSYLTILAQKHVYYDADPQYMHLMGSMVLYTIQPILEEEVGFYMHF